jgi:outer membrane protein OmpA-like peptidoglycan-associated protein
MKHLIAVTMVLASASAARAQQSTSFDAEQFHPTSTSNGYFAVDGAFVAPHLGFSAGAYLSYAHDPLLLRHGDQVFAHVVQDQVSMDLVGSFALFDHLELGLDLPFAPLLGQPAYAADAHVPLVSAGALGDLRIDIKALLWAPRLDNHQFGLTLILGGAVPTGDSSSFFGEGGVIGRPRLVAQWRSRWASVAINFGAVLRSQQVYNDLYVTHQLSYGAAMSVALPAGLSVIGELDGLIGVGLPDNVSLTPAETPAEVTAGVRWRAPFGLELDLAGGGGLTRGYGTPDGRFIFGMRYVSPERKRTLPAARPVARPSQPAPTYDPMYLEPSFAEPAGGPRPDQDRDGVPDIEDRCPDRPGAPENQGCPEFDSDGDGIVDRLDKCPFDPETFNGVNDDDGCPDSPAALAALNGDKIVIFEPVQFDSDSPAVDQRSDKLLSVVAHILNLHPEILKLRVAAHAEKRGDSATALEVAKARANAVRRWLVDKGHVDAQRLSATGYAADRKSRRLEAIEFVVTQRLNTDPP